MRLQIIIFVALFLIASVSATDHYSYEHAESLKPLIDWRTYTPATFDEAISENKPIFMLLTAPSWCYWCQVYESEEYLFDPSVIETLNADFIPIYVDADQRQDLTRQYLEGGWPSTTVMAPNRERLYGYSGPRPVSNMLANLDQAKNHVESGGFFNRLPTNYQKTEAIVPTETDLNNLINGYAGYLLNAYDEIDGGFGTGQKFPQGRSLDFSLELYEKTGNDRWLEIVQNTLRNQYTALDEIETNYNLFDPVEGGFHRYGTRKDWTPPHYEKMLYDNARLMVAYSHFLEITPNDEIAKEVVLKTLQYMESEWYDDQKGGFYGNTDVHGEDHYYAENPRPKEKARVEPAKYSDWNADAIIMALYLSSTDDRYEDIARKSLNFFSDTMITDAGAYHYEKEGVRGVRGSLLDNANLLHAFVQGYESLGDDKYLVTAILLADYSLENLYDWHGGGFFERNSPDLDLYAPGDNIHLSKPSAENGVMSYALLRLYTHTNDSQFLNAGIKSLGQLVGTKSGLDRGYYAVKAAEYAVDNDLLIEFDQRVTEIENFEADAQDNFWLSEPEKKDFAISEEGLEKLEGPIPLLVMISLIAGLISFASPCSLPILPAYVAYTMQSAKRNVKVMTLMFFFGLSGTFALLGMSAGLIGNIIQEQLATFSKITGILIMLFGAFLLLGKGISGLKIQIPRPTGYLGSLFFGSALSISWTPCVGPILISVLLLASTAHSALTGGLLLFAYGIGLSLPLIATSIYLNKKDRKIWTVLEGKTFRINLGRQYTINSTTLISALLFIVLGYLMFSGTLASFNQYITTTGFQKWLFGLEDALLSLMS